jgi:outer membrane protein TolC
MSRALRCVSSTSLLLAVMLAFGLPLPAAPLPLKRAVELALSHSTTAVSARAEEQRAFAAYRESRNQYIPQLMVGSGLGATWGYPLSLEGSAPSIVNVNAQSALINPALRDFVRAARTEWQASTVQNKDQRNQVIQETALTYAELAKWEQLLGHLQQEQSDALQAEQVVNERIQEGVDSALSRSRAQLVAARARLSIAQAQGTIDVLRQRLSALTGLPAASIETVPESIPPLPEIQPTEDLAAKAVTISPAVQVAEDHATAQDFRARGEHRSLWPSVDFASQYAILATFNGYQNFFREGSFQRNNASVGVVIRFPFFNLSQHARAQAADADAIRAHKAAEAAKNQVSEETLKLQRAVEQLAAAQNVADLEYQVAKSNLDAIQIRSDAGTASWHDVEDARTQAYTSYNQLQDANFELERARITLLRATGELENWAMSGS